MPSLEFNKERKEHPSFSNQQIEQILKDHRMTESETVGEYVIRRLKK